MKDKEIIILTKDATYCDKHYAYHGKDIRMYLHIEFKNGPPREIGYTSESQMLKDHKKIVEEIDKNSPAINPFTPSIRSKSERVNFHSAMHGKFSEVSQ